WLKVSARAESSSARARRSRASDRSSASGIRGPPTQKKRRNSSTAGRASGSPHNGKVTARGFAVWELRLLCPINLLLDPLRQDIVVRSDFLHCEAGIRV